MRWLVAVAVVAGCGEGGGSADAPIEPDPGQLVRLTVTRSGLPAVGARVVFQDAASNVVSDTVTGDDGSAAAVMDAGGFVTLVEPKDPPVSPNPPPTINDKLATFAAVEPGDRLEIDLAPKPPAVIVTMSAPPTPDAVLFNVTSTCGNGTISQADGVVVPAMITLGDCRGSADIALVAVDGLGTMLRGMYRDAAAIDDHAVVGLTGEWAPLVVSTVMLDPSPPWAVYAAVELAVRSSRGTVLARTQLVDPAAPVARFTLPPTTGTTAAVGVSLVPDVTGFGKQRLVRWGLPVIDPAMATSSLVLAPYLSKPTWDAASRTVTWTEGTGARADAARTEIHTFRDGFPAHVWDWQLIAPRGAAPSVTYPSFPADGDFDFAPKAGDSTGVTNVETISVSGGYRAIRARALRTRLDIPAAGPSGQLSYQQVNTPDN